MNKEITFGTKVKVDARFYRTDMSEWRLWDVTRFYGEGIVIGTRTIYDGVMCYYDRFGERCKPSEAVDRHFERRRQIKAYLVAFPNRNPEYIPTGGIIEVLR